MKYTLPKVLFVILMIGLLLTACGGTAPATDAPAAEPGETRLFRPQNRLPYRWRPHHRHPH